MSKDKDRVSGLQAALEAFPLLLWSRRDVLFMLTWCTTIGMLVATRGTPPFWSAFTVLCSTLFVGASVYIYNDLVDAEMDRISPNKRTRPIASGKVEKSLAWPTIVASGIAGLLLAYLINLQTLIASASWFSVFFIYSYPGIHLKKRFIIKEVVVSTAWPFCSLIGSLGVTGGVSIPAFFSGLLFGVFIFLVQPALVDTLDEYQDAMFGVKTLARTLGWGRKVQLLILGMLFMMTVTPLTYTRMGFNVILPISVVAFSLVLLRWGIYPLTKGYEVNLVLRFRKFMYVYFLGLQVILIISSLNFLSRL